MKALWTGAIGFGLVNIPVRLFSAVQESELNLDLLDKKDHAHIRFKRVNEDTGREVAWNNIVKAYAYKGSYVVLDDKDFEKASAKKSKIIEINEFVAQEQIDQSLYEVPYYLEPDKAGAKAYALLRQALVKSGKVGIGSFVLRTKEHLCLLQPKGKLIVLFRCGFRRRYATALR
jgi:DNA end-binding protein Ku